MQENFYVLFLFTVVSNGGVYVLFLFTVVSNGGVATTLPLYLSTLKTYSTPGESPIHPVFASK